MKTTNLHRLLLLGALLVSLSAKAATVSPYSGARIFWDETSRKTVFSSGGYARVLELQDGRLMAVCESGGIRCAFSNDKGKTWTMSQLVASNPSKVSECVPDLIQLTDGTIIVAYNPRPHEPYSEERKFGIRCRRSTDNGKTWSEEIFVNDAHHLFTDGCWEPSMLELPSGELQLYFADEGPYTNSGEQQISLCRSFDQGRTWSKPENISFRAGHRDGMPVPILLKDQSAIVVAIEDNGLGYNAFFPATVRTTLTDNWKSGYVSASSSKRLKAVDTSIAPTWLGGAPYLRQLSTGETVISYQSDHRKGGVFQMVAGVGDNKARNFKSLTHPFAYVEGQSIMWNSLAVVEDSVVMAVGGVAGKIEVVKGYLKYHFECPYATPKVDGKYSTSEGYHGRPTPQIHMGNDLGFAYQMDFAYDTDSLYFIVRAYDKTQKYTGDNLDGVRLTIEAKGLSNNRATPSSYQYQCMLNGGVTRAVGASTTFKEQEATTAHLVARRTTTYYILELAIPWSDMDVTELPTDKMPRVNIELINATSDGVQTEMLVDARNTETWTWMPLNLGALPEGAAISSPKEINEVTLRTNGGMLNVQSETPIQQICIYDVDGHLLGQHTVTGCQPSVPLPKGDILLVKLTLRDGQIINRKIRR